MEKSPIAQGVSRGLTEVHLKDDFRYFLWIVWQHLRLPDPTLIQYDIARFLQHGPNRRGIEAFRGVGKSWITASYVLWLLFCDPECRVLVVSASKDRADAFSVFVKRLISEMPILAHLKPDPSKGDRDSNVAFDVAPASAAQAPSVRSVGITGQLTGGRATHIIVDDVEVPKNSLTELQRFRLSELVKEFDAVLVPGGHIIYLGTPQTEQSLYNALPLRGYTFRIWPARYPTPTQRAGYTGKLAQFIGGALDLDPSLAGQPTEPTRFGEMELMAREASYGRSGFALQFMLDTSLSDANRYPLKLADLLVMDLDKEIAPVRLAWASGPTQVIEGLPNVGFGGDRYHRPMYVATDKWIEYEGSVMFIDPAGRGKDRTGFAVVKMLKGMLFLTRAGALQGGYDEDTLETLAYIAKAEKVNLVLAEPNFGDGMFLELLKPVFSRIYDVTIEESERATTQKEARIIDTLEPVLNSHRLVVDQALIVMDHSEDEGSHQLFYQLTHITRSRGALRHDDVLDALAGAVWYWIQQLGSDTAKAEKVHRANLFDEELQVFMEHLVDGTGVSLNRTKFNKMSWD